MADYHQVLKMLLLSSLGRDVDGKNLISVDWQQVMELAVSQGVSCLAVDGYSRLLVKGLIAQDAVNEITKLQWIAGLVAWEQKYHQMLDDACQFAEDLEKMGVPCYVLKGFAYSQYYPKPEHREFGDFDCFLPIDFEKGCRAIADVGGRIVSSDYKHAQVKYKKLTIESHRKLIQTRDGRGRKELNDYLASIISQDGKHYIGDSKLTSPNATFNALFLIEHATHHFLFEKITLRFVCDWACLLDRCQDEIDWNEFNRWIDKMGYRRFVGVMTYLAVENLGLQLKENRVPLDGKYAEKVCDDMFDDKIAMVSNADDDTQARINIILNRYRQLWKYHKIMKRSATVELAHMAYSYVRE